MEEQDRINREIEEEKRKNELEKKEQEMKRIKTIEAFEKMNINGNNSDSKNKDGSGSKEIFNNEQIDITMGGGNNNKGKVFNTNSESKSMLELGTNNNNNNSVTEHLADNNSQFDAISAKPNTNHPEKDVVVDKGLLENLLDENQNLKDEASKNKVLMDFLTQVIMKKKEKESFVNSNNHQDPNYNPNLQTMNQDSIKTELQSISHQQIPNNYHPQQQMDPRLLSGNSQHYNVNYNEQSRYNVNANFQQYPQGYGFNINNRTNGMSRALSANTNQNELYNTNKVLYFMFKFYYRI